MTYSSAVAYLYRLQKHGIKLGLVTMTGLMVRLGMPQTRYRTLHIAGTNGKGSTAAMAAAVLQAAGYRVGLYTSPHLVEFRERIRVNGEMIAESRVARLTEQLQALCQPDLSPTFFEYTTAMAFQHFADSRVDVAVLEVGLGGRFDATNVIAPMACAVIGRSMSAVRPCPWRSTAMTWCPCAKACRFGPNMSMDPRPPCSRTSGRPDPWTS